MPEKHDIVQITNPKHHWYPCLIIVSEVKSFGIQGYTYIPKNNIGDIARAYIRLKHEDFETVGSSVIVPQDDEE